ncbi:hypothetical protein P5673_010415 [Acropora cervicornis]|uniref:Uncharacterized protein n=1 Tax=Acropora cervicornis TaxID=6130 RepID=A0AAD9QRL3_ACRCE|nr:hypothetical protein P5673_010415 [Acropora cervicornis]
MAAFDQEKEVLVEFGERRHVMWISDKGSLDVQMLLKEVKNVFSIQSERSVHGRPSWELAPYDRESERTKDFTAWCRDASTECCFNERAGECGVVRFTSQFFVLDKSKSIPIRIGGQTAWEAVRNDFIENKEKIASNPTSMI